MKEGKDPLKGEIENFAILPLLFPLCDELVLSPKIFITSFEKE